MGLLESSHKVVAALANAPGLRHLAVRRYRDRFANNVNKNLFMGVYRTFEEAEASSPKTRPAGYNNQGSARIAYAPRVRPGDYPAIHWLNRSFIEGARSVLDLGGHLGVKFYAFENMMEYPDAMRWTVCDVPAVVEQGRAVAAERAVSDRLHFTDDYRAIGDHDVLYATGSLQYLPTTLAELLQNLQVRPKRVVINFTPMHLERSFFTINSIGTAFCSYRVQARSEFVQQMCDLGYVKRDDWFTADKGMVIPYEDGYDVKEFSGFCFDLPGEGFRSEAANAPLMAANSDRLSLTAT